MMHSFIVERILVGLTAYSLLHSLLAISCKGQEYLYHTGIFVVGLTTRYDSNVDQKLTDYGIKSQTAYNLRYK